MAADATVASATAAASGTGTATATAAGDISHDEITFGNSDGDFVQEGFTSIFVDAKNTS